MKIINKHLKNLIVLVILLLMAGCTNSVETGNKAEESKSEHNMRMFLNELLNGPSEEQKRLLLETPDGDLEEFGEKVSRYNEEHIKPYVSERFFEGLLNTNGTTPYLRVAHNNDYELKAEKITLEEKNNYYEFTAQVTCTNDNNESNTINIKGHLQMNEEDKVTSITHVNFEEFRTAMEKE